LYDIGGLWDRDSVFISDKFEKKFGWGATPPEQVIQEIVKVHGRAPAAEPKFNFFCT
jgi:hypothetical protein